MYEIAALKSKKLPELQEIAKSIGVKRITGLKKIDLIYQIIDHVSANPTALNESPKQPKNDQDTDIHENESKEPLKKPNFKKRSQEDKKENTENPRKQFEDRKGSKNQNPNKNQHKNQQNQNPIPTTTTTTTTTITTTQIKERATMATNKITIATTATVTVNPILSLTASYIPKAY